MPERLYPRWRYHPQLGGVIVKTPEEEAATTPNDSGWVDHPSQFPPPPPPEPEIIEPVRDDFAAIQEALPKFPRGKKGR